MRNRVTVSLVLLGAAGWLFATSALVIGIGNGCSTTQSQQAINSLGSIGKSMDAAYLSYMELVATGAVSTNSVADVTRRYAEFKAVWNIALALAATQTNAPLPAPDLSNAQSQLKLAIKAAKAPAK